MLGLLLGGMYLWRNWLAAPDADEREQFIRRVLVGGIHAQSQDGRLVEIKSADIAAVEASTCRWDAAQASIFANPRRRGSYACLYRLRRHDGATFVGIIGAHYAPSAAHALSVGAYVISNWAPALVEQKLAEFGRHCC